MAVSKKLNKTKQSASAIKRFSPIELSGTKRLNLDYKDINFISVVSQKTKIPKEKLINFMATQAVSKDARDIAMMILGESNSTGVKSVERKRQIAKHYKDWVAEISRSASSSTAKPGAVRKSTATRK